tara:strand:- start:212 stop:511 length:300 start_codon:yes stop_codon:yes gene_type:complete
MKKSDFDTLDANKLRVACEWLNSLPLYMFTGELTLQLLKFSYDCDNLDNADRSLRAVLNYQASLIAPLDPELFIDYVKRVYHGPVPDEIADFFGDHSVQ